MDEDDLKARIVASGGGPIRRLIAKRYVRNKSLDDIVDLINSKRPKDVVEQQGKVAAAEGLIFIAPVFWMGFPAILSGWIHRVFSYGFVYSMTQEGWDGHVSGRIPLMKQRKALIVNTTFFSEEDYREGGWQVAMSKIIGEWGLMMPGVKDVEHVFFHSPLAMDDEARSGYLERAYRLGKEFEPLPRVQHPAA